MCVEVLPRWMLPRPPEYPGVVSVVNRFVVNAVLAHNGSNKINVRSIRTPIHALLRRVSLELKEPSMDHTDLRTNLPAIEAISATVRVPTTT